jgi:hypothetical protein
MFASVIGTVWKRSQSFLIGLQWIVVTNDQTLLEKARHLSSEMPIPLRREIRLDMDSQKVCECVRIYEDARAAVQ